MPKRVRAAAALVAVAAVAAYALPVFLGAVTYAAHDLYHLHERLAAIAPHVATDGEGHHPFVHEHGNGMHSHDAAVDALLSATQHEESSSQKHAAASIDMTGHLPARREAWVLAPSLMPPAEVAPQARRPRFLPPPLLPPPRA